MGLSGDPIDMPRLRRSAAALLLSQISALPLGMFPGTLIVNRGLYGASCI